MAWLEAKREKKVTAEATFILERKMKQCRTKIGQDIRDKMKRYLDRVS